MRTLILPTSLSLNEHAATEIASSVDGPITFDLEIYQVVAVHEAIARDHPELSVIIVECYARYEWGWALVFRKAFQSVACIDEEVLLLHYDQVLPTGRELHLVAASVVECPILSELVIQDVHHTHSVYEGCCHVVT